MGKGDFGSKHLAVTWVTGGPGSEQPQHEHPENEQAYVIVAGRGEMLVGDDRLDVEPGTLVLVPPRTRHAIRNTGRETLTYVSATSPPFEPPSPESGFAYR
jgi:mannose-6-phosphate isomerase-like protein (cupin superfamily)